MLISVVIAAAMVTDPVWISRPSGTDIALAYPDGAARASLQARAVLICTATEGGLLADCVVEAEDPPGMGFDAAVLELSRRFKLQPQDKQGASVVGRPVRIPIRFVLGTQARTSKIVVRRSEDEATGEVTLDCRVNLEAKLDNCFANGPNELLKEAALSLVDEMNSTVPSTARRSSTARVLVPVVFKEERAR
jgi:TonB family protein